MDLPRRSRKKTTPRICDYWLVCAKCGRRQLVASGYIGSAFHEDEDLVCEACEKLGWDYALGWCWACRGLSNLRLRSKHHADRKNVHR